MNEINAIITKAEKCTYNLTCTKYMCRFKHDTASGLSPKAEEKREKLKAGHQYPKEGLKNAPASRGGKQEEEKKVDNNANDILAKIESMNLGTKVSSVPKDSKKKTKE